MDNNHSPANAWEMKGNTGSLKNKMKLFDANKNNIKWDFLVEPNASMEADRLLSYFQTRTTVRYFPISKGTNAHVAIADRIVENVFEFNNEIHRLPENFDWKCNPSQDVEWLILLHKFYFTRDLGAAYRKTGDDKYVKKWVQLLTSWIENVTEGFIDSQVTGRRLQQWILSYHYFIPQKSSSAIQPSFLVQLLESIQNQTYYLSENLTEEGNHRTIELYAIFLVAVIFPELRSAEYFLSFSTQEILKNIQRDFLSDGVHGELSTDYHHTVLKNFLRIRELASLNQISFSSEYDDLIKKALEFSLYVHKPDGFIPAISDGDNNSYLSLLKKGYAHYQNQNLLYAASQGKRGLPPPWRSQGFHESGYYILRSDWNDQPYDEGLYFFFDCAPLGKGPHGHYDLLNFEMAAYGHSLIVDTGRYTYSEKSEEGINWRQVFKGTAYHNTILIDGKDQIQYRLGEPKDPEPKPFLKEFTTAEGFDFLNGLAASYEYPVIHERKVFFLLPEYWIIVDCLSVKGRHAYDLHFHLHPRALDRTELIETKKTTLVATPNLIIGQPRPPISDGIKSGIVEGFVSPRYGEKYKAPIVKFSQKVEGSALYHTLLYPYRTTKPDISMEEVPVFHQAVLCPRDQATALKIMIRKDDFSCCDYFFLAHGDNTKEYTFEDIRYRGGLLLLRKDVNGRITNLQAKQINFLSERGRTVADFGSSIGRLSLKKGNLYIDTDAVDFEIALDEFQKVVRRGNIGGS